jgi:hypothetical protein
MKAPFELEHRVLRVDGSLGWTFSRAVPLFDKRGEIVEWFGPARDVSRRKEAELALAETNAWPLTQDCMRLLVCNDQETARREQQDGR